MMKRMPKVKTNVAVPIGKSDLTKRTEDANSGWTSVPLSFSTTFCSILSGFSSRCFFSSAITATSRHFSFSFSDPRRIIVSIMDGVDLDPSSLITSSSSSSSDAVVSLLSISFAEFSLVSSIDLFEICKRGEVQVHTTGHGHH